MDEQDELQILDDALDELPKEASDFLYNGDYAKALDGITSALGLTPQQKSELDYHLTRVVALIETRNDLLSLCDKWKYTMEQKQTFVSLVEDTIFEPLEEATNYIVEGEEDEEDEGEKKSQTPSSILSNKFLQPSAAGVAKRDYSLERTTPSVSESAEPKKFDPYHEAIDK